VTQPQDPRTNPLQDDEIALARVLRALPAGEPSAKVDAAILSAATDAVNGAAAPVASSPRRAVKTTRWVLPGWAIGTAAAAVLAVGIGMQLRPPLAPEPTSTSAQPASKQAAAREQVSVELVDPEERTIPPAAPPPESKPASADRAGRPPPPPPPPVPQAAPPAPVAEAADAFPMEAPAEPPASTADAATLDRVEVTGTRLPERFDSGETMRREQPTALADRARRRAAAKAEMQARAQQAEAESMARDQALQARQAQANADLATGAAPPPPAAPAASAPPPSPLARESQGAGAAGATLPPVAEDAALTPEAWIARVRERLRLGDEVGACASLRLYLQAHPDAPVPSDLDRLR
jgi:type IV secretory pathway VirB10-like protein